MNGPNSLSRRARLAAGCIACCGTCRRERLLRAGPPANPRHGPAGHDGGGVDRRRQAAGASGAAVAGAAGVIAGAVALNQRLERARGRENVAHRPASAPAGRLSGRQATWFGVGMSLGGFAWLGVWSSPLVVAMAAGSWLVYVWVYTPLKSITIWQTPIGAAAGAAPILLARRPSAPWQVPPPGSFSPSLFSGSFRTRWPSPGFIGGSSPRPR